MTRHRLARTKSPVHPAFHAPPLLLRLLVSNDGVTPMLSQARRSRTRCCRADRDRRRGCFGCCESCTKAVYSGRKEIAMRTYALSIEDLFRVFPLASEIVKSTIPRRRRFRSGSSPQLTTGWPKKVSHYQVSSLNRIKNRH